MFSSALTTKQSFTIVIHNVFYKMAHFMNVIHSFYHPQTKLGGGRGGGG